MLLCNEEYICTNDMNNIKKLQHLNKNTKVEFSKIIMTKKNYLTIYDVKIGNNI